MNIGRNEILIGVAVVVVLVLIAVPIAVSSSKSSRRDEVPLNVNGIRTAEIQYQEAFGEYVPAAAAPRALHAVDAEPMTWEPTDGFKKLSWAPEGEQVLGAYQVQADSDGFKVTGACDVDGDGERAVFEATADQEATAVSEASVY